MNPPPVVLAESGVGYRQYRIPALALTRGGTLVAAYDGRPDLDDLPAPIDLLVRSSRDGGRTWSPQRVARRAVGLTGYGDPSLLADRVTGRLWCFHAAGSGVGFFESSEGTADDDPAVLHCDAAFSDDEGVTWASRRLTAELRAGLNARLAASADPRLAGRRVRGLFAASGAGAQVVRGPHTGRLLQGFVALIGAELWVVVARSDDHGRTWTLGDPLGPGANESALAALPDGRVLLHSRAPGRRLQAFSLDGGETFGPLGAADDLPDPGNNGSLLALPDGTLLASHTADPDLRRRLVLSRSTDTGESWAPAVELTAGGAGYSVAVALPDGAVGVLWEDEGYRRLLFARVDPDAAAGPSCEQDSPDLCAAPAPTAVLEHVIPARPEGWIEVGESVELELDADDYDDAVFKIVAGDGGRQRVATRAAYARNLGPLHRGLAAGDTLVWAARLPAQHGGAVVRRGLRHVVTAADVAAGVVRLDGGAVGLSGAQADVRAEIPIHPHPPLEDACTR